MKKLTFIALSAFILSCQEEKVQEEVQQTPLTMKDLLETAQKYDVKVYKRDTSFKYASIEDSLEALSQPLPHFENMEQLEAFMQHAKDNEVTEAHEKDYAIFKKFGEETEKAKTYEERNKIIEKYKEKYPEIFENDL